MRMSPGSEDSARAVDMAVLRVLVDTLDAGLEVHRCASGEVEQWAGRTARYDEQQIALCSAQCHVQQASRIHLVGERVRVAREKDHAIALQSLRLVNRAKGALGGLRARIGSPMRDLFQAIVDIRESAKMNHVRELALAINLDVACAKVAGVRHRANPEKRLSNPDMSRVLNYLPRDLLDGERLSRACPDATGPRLVDTCVSKG